jgi:hypothetical protein
MTRHSEYHCGHTWSLINQDRAPKPKQQELPKPKINSLPPSKTLHTSCLPTALAPTAAVPPALAADVDAALATTKNLE